MHTKASDIRDRLLFCPNYSDVRFATKFELSKNRVIIASADFDVYRSMYASYGLENVFENEQIVFK